MQASLLARASCCFVPCLVGVALPRAPTPRHFTSQPAGCIRSIFCGSRLLQMNARGNFPCSALSPEGHCSLSSLFCLTHVRWCHVVAYVPSRCGSECVSRLLGDSLMLRACECKKVCDAIMKAMTIIALVIVPVAIRLMFIIDPPLGFRPPLGG